MKRLQVFEKTVAELANLAAGEADPVLLLQFAADLFPLAVVKVSLEADMNLQVVAIGPSGRYPERQRFGSHRHQCSRRMAAVRLARANRFMRDEIALLQRHDPMLDRLLDLGQTAALGTGPLGRLHLDPDTGGALDAPPPILLQPAELQSQCCKRREAGFFLPSS